MLQQFGHSTIEAIRVVSVLRGKIYFATELSNIHWPSQFVSCLCCRKLSYRGKIVAIVRVVLLFLHFYTQATEQMTNKLTACRWTQSVKG